MRHLKVSGLACTGLAVCLALALSACKPNSKAEAPEVRPFRTVTAAKGDAAETVVLTGHIQADDEPSFAFRIGGRVIERPVNLGDRVKAGQVLAKLDPETELSALRSGQSALIAAQGQLTYAWADFERQRQLLANGHTAWARFDQAQKTLQVAQSQVDDAEARLDGAFRGIPLGNALGCGRRLYRRADPDSGRSNLRPERLRPPDRGPAVGG